MNKMSYVLTKVFNLWSWKRSAFFYRTPKIRLRKQ